MTKKMQQNIIFMVLIVAGLGYVFYNYLLTPLQQKHRDTIDQLQKTETKLSDMRRRALQLPQLQAEMKQLETEVAGLEKLLPKDKEMPELLRTVTKKAHRYQLKINNITPQAAAVQANYTEIPFQITAQGTYHGIAHFLAEIGQESRILSTRNINYTAIAASKDNASTVNVIFTLVAYTFKG